MITSVSDAHSGGFWCLGCEEPRQGEFWNVAWKHPESVRLQECQLCRGCMSTMVNRLLAKLCPGEEVQKHQSRKVRALTADQLNCLDTISKKHGLVVGPTESNNPPARWISLATARFLVRNGYAKSCGLFDRPETGDYIEITQAGIDYLKKKQQGT